ncbi:MAG: transposase [Burkholderiales bacterium]|nr:transposase [Burkholderiales bacterium]
MGRSAEGGGTATGHLAWRTHRTNTLAFKAELVAAGLEPGLSIAALASSYGMNANVLHRRLKDHARTGCRQPVAPQLPSTIDTTDTSPSVPEFIALRLPGITPEAIATEFKVDLRKGALSATVTWPIHAAADFARFAQWAVAVLN